MKTTKTTYSIIFAVVLIALAVLALVKFLPKSGIKTEQAAEKNKQASPAVPKIEAKPIEKNQVPAGFPDNMPWEKNAAILQNFEAKDPVSPKTQYTRVYASSKTMDENIQIYQKYFFSNGWALVGSIDQASIKKLNATKGSASFDITVSKDPAGKVAVNVTYME